MTKQQILNEVEEFKLEYPEYTSEHVEEYLRLCDDYTEKDKSFFASCLGY